MRLAVITVLSLAAPFAGAQNLTVNSTLDLPDADLEDGVCDADLETEGLQVTLRAAVMHANVTEGADTIELPAGLYKLTIKGAQENEAATGDLDVLSDLTILGASSDTTIIDGKKAKDRIFDVRSANLTLLDVTLRRGTAFPPTADDDDSTGGGGIRAASANLSLERTVVSRCKSFDDGGGIEIGDGILTLVDSTIERCFSKDDGGGVDCDDGQVSASGTTFFRNSAKDEGGGLEGSTALIDAVNCTFFGNRAKEEGGAMSLEDGSETTLAFCTFVSNRAAQGAGVSSSDGFNLTSATNCVFGDKKKINCDGVIDGSGNLDTGTTCGFDQTNLTDTKPLLKKAAFNGGPTRTCAPKPTSPVIDGALELKGFECPETDQRGEPRVEPCDIGAYEVGVEDA